MQLTSAADRASLAEEQAALRREASLRRIATLVAGGVTAGELFSAVAREVSVVLGAPVVTVDRYEIEGGSTVSVVLASLEDAQFPVGGRWPLDGPSARAWIHETRGTVRIEDFSGLDSTVAAAARKQGMRWAVGAPIVVDGAVWGNIVAGTTGHEPIPDDAESRLADFTRLVSTAIANSDARDEVGRLLAEQAALRRVATLVAEGPTATELFAAVAKEVADVLGLGTVTVDRYEPDGTCTVMAAWGHGGFPVGSRWPLDGTSLAGTVLATGRSARIDDYSELSGAIASVVQEGPFVSTVGVPIVVDGALWGAICVGVRRVEDMPSDTEARLAGFTELVATAIANSDAREKVRRLVEEQASLRRVATLVARAPASEQLFSTVAREVAAVLDVPGVLVERFEADGAVVAIGAAYGSELAGAERVLGIGTRTPPDPGSLTAQVFETHRTARVDDYSTLPGDVGDVARAAGVGSGCAGPIVVNGDLWGQLAVFSRAGSVLPAGTENRLHDFIELVAMAIANYEARADLAASEAHACELAHEQAALRRVATLVAEGASAIDVFTAVAKEVAGLFDAAAVSLSRYEDDCCVVVAICGSGFPVGSRWPLDVDSLAKRVLATERPVYVEDYSAIARQLPNASPVRPADLAVAVPIVVDGHLWGILSVGAPDLRSALPETVDRISTFAELAATAIGNSDARESVRRLIDEQTALRRVATLVAENAGAEELLSAVAEEVASVLGVPAVTIDRFDEDGSATTVVASCNVEGQLAWPVGSRWPLDGPSVAATVWKTGRAARIDDYRELPGSIAAVFRDRPRARTIGVPIVVGNRVWGMIGVGSVDDDVPGAVEGRLARFTELVATAIANSESRAELSASEAWARELAEEQAALRRVATLVVRAPESEQLFSTVAREVASVLNVPGVIVQRYEADGTVVTFGDAFDSELAGAERFLGVGSRMPLDPGSLAAQVFETHGTARLDDFSALPGTIGDLARSAGLGSGCAAPIVVNGDLWGKLCVFSARGSVLPVGTENRLHDFIDLVAMAIANYEARAELATSEARSRELAREQAALRRVATLVAQGASPDELFSAVAEEVAGIIDIPVVGVHRYEPDGTFTVLGIAGDSNLTIGSRWRAADEGIAKMILDTGRPSRKDDYTSMPGPLGDAVRDGLTLSAVGVPIVVEGTIWGFMVAAGEPGRPIPADTEERLARFTELVATAVSNATTRTELLASRVRVVSAADETRRRLERDLHDGIQQWLVALALRARKAAGLSPSDESAVQELSGLADDLVAVTDELRELSRGIHPAILSDAGLDDALAALARRSAIRIDLDVSFGGRYDPALEATVYYVAAESVTNAVKHGHASTVTVRGGRRDGAIELEIRDDGVGGADPQRGTGMIGLKDRVDTLGGTISFASPAGAGTTIRVELPARPRAAAPASG